MHCSLFYFFIAKYQSFCTGQLSIYWMDMYSMNTVSQKLLLLSAQTFFPDFAIRGEI